MKKLSAIFMLCLLTLAVSACGDDNDKNEPVANDPRAIASVYDDSTEPHYEFAFDPATSICKVMLYNVQFSIDDRVSPKLNIRIDVPYTLTNGIYRISQNTETIIPYQLRGESFVPAEQFPVTGFNAVVNVLDKTYSLAFSCHGGSFSDSGKTK